ncbi:MAG: ABC-type uncharacterized transport system [Gemmataceae bacterium]|nr:ABC-type uncharacterized transport system [Gemmataceae bacterium]
MNPTPYPTPTPDAAAPGPAPAGQQLVEFVRTQRQTAAYVFLGLSVVFLAATIMLAVRSVKTTKPAADTPAATNPLDPDAPPDAPKPEVADPKKYDYTVGWIGALIGFLVAAGVGGYLMVGLPNPSVDRQRTEARVVLLTAGGLIGFALIVFGGWYFYRWSDSLTKWLDKGEKKEMVWVVAPLLMVVGGAGLVFAAVQPARAEERNNLSIRRLVYGSNFGLTVLLLLVVLVVANVAIAMKVPNKLDTTETGFYTLSEGTKNFLGKLTEPVTLYVIMPDTGDRLTNDIRQFAYSTQEAGGGRVTAKFVSPVSGKGELQRLQDKYPRIGRDDEGVLITAGEDEKRNAFVPLADLFEMDQQRGRRPKAFVGESRVMRELRFLAENEQKPAIYFTQGNGELSISGDRTVATAVGGSATQLKAFLEKSYLDVRPLTFPLQNPVVPDDATVVIVAEPQTPLAPAAAAAIQKYMAEPRKSGGKGKLIVAAGAAAGPDGRGVVKTGLEGVLSGFGVRLGDKFVYSVPTERSPEYQTLAMFSRASVQNPITQALAPQVQAIGFLYPREVEVSKDNPQAQFQATSLLISQPGRPTWLEDDRITDIELVFRDLVQNPTARERKKLTDDARPLAAVVSESGGPHGGPAGTGRLLVLGNAFIFSDKFAERVRGGGAPATFDLMAVGIDWLRDRPPLTTGETKTYVTYNFPEPATIDTTRLLYLPLGLGLLTVAGLGIGVWVIRRK